MAKVSNSSTARANELFETFAIYPNPATSDLYLHIKSHEQGVYQLRLSNLQGQAVLNSSLSVMAGEQTRVLDVSQLPAGVYSLQASDGKGVISRKVVKR